MVQCHGVMLSCYRSLSAKLFFMSNRPGGFTGGTEDILDGGHSTRITLPSISASGTYINTMNLWYGHELTTCDQHQESAVCMHMVCKMDRRKKNH